MARMSDVAQYLAAYDEQLRTDAEIAGADAVTRLGPLYLAGYPGGRGFVTYRDLAGADEATIAHWVAEAAWHFADEPAATEVEWKARGHDRAPGLHESLLAAGFSPEEPESIMIGEARLLMADVQLPEGVTLRRVTDESDVHAVSVMQAEVFPGGPSAETITDSILRRMRSGDLLQLWAAEHNGIVVSAGRMDPVPDTEFVGIWGGATRPEWRKRGIYRALTAVRAREALALGKRLVHSDSTEYSRPILERAGLVKVSTTTPYVWRR